MKEEDWEEEDWEEDLEEEEEELWLSQNNCAPLSFYSNFWRTVFAQLRDLSLLFSFTNLTLMDE